MASESSVAKRVNVPSVVISGDQSSSPASVFLTKASKGENVHLAGLPIQPANGFTAVTWACVTSATSPVELTSTPVKETARTTTAQMIANQSSDSRR